MTEAAAAEGKVLYRLPDGRYTTQPPNTEVDPQKRAAAESAWRESRAAGDPRSFSTWVRDHVRANPEDADLLNIFKTATPVADFTGLGADTRLQRDIEAALQLQRGGADISRELERGRLEDLRDLLPAFNALNIAQQRAAYQAALEAAKAGEQQRLDLELAYRPKFTASELEAQQKAFDQSLEQGIGATRRLAGVQTELLPWLNNAQLKAQQEAFDQSLEQGIDATRQIAGLQSELLPWLNNAQLAAQGKAFDQSLEQG
ncbi:MAG: hypothetical protein D6781_02265, partial [Verrucomicrobia bacterium]